jgi:hypothetical protein
MSAYVMWISIFAATISFGICFCAATIMIEAKSDQSQAALLKPPVHKQDG